MKLNKHITLAYLRTWHWLRLPPLPLRQLVKSIELDISKQVGYNHSSFVAKTNTDLI